MTKHRKTIERERPEKVNGNWDGDIFFLNGKAYTIDLVLVKADFPRRWEIVNKRVPERDLIPSEEAPKTEAKTVPAEIIAVSRREKRDGDVKQREGGKAPNSGKGRKDPLPRGSINKGRRSSDSVRVSHKKHIKRQKRVVHRPKRKSN